MWIDESKYNLNGPDGNLKVRNPKGKRLDPKYTRETVKHCGGKDAMVRDCFSGFSVVGPIYRINGIMDRFVYRDILEEKMFPHVDNNMPLLWIFQQDEPKHTSKLVKQCFEMNQIEVIKWLAQSPDLNPIENLCTWNKIAQEKIDKLIESMLKRCSMILKSKGYPINY